MVAINAGVYIITCSLTQSVYIGESGNLTRRKQNHFNPNYPHHNPQLQQDMVTHGISNFTFTVLETLQNKSSRLKAEKKWFDHYQALGHTMYNRRAGSKGGYVSQSVRQSLSQANTGKQHTVSTKARISASLTGKIRKRSSVRKTAKAHKGKVVSADTKRKMSEAHKGQTLDEATREKLSAAKKGKQYRKGTTQTKETRQKIAAGVKARYALRSTNTEPVVEQ